MYTKLPEPVEALYIEEYSYIECHFGIRTKVATMRHAIGNGMIIGLSLALLWHFSNIWRYGQYLIGEPNIVIRSLETGGLLAIFIFGISNYISLVKREIAEKDRDRRNNNAKL